MPPNKLELRQRRTGKLRANLSRRFLADVPAREIKSLNAFFASRRFLAGLKMLFRVACCAPEAHQPLADKLISPHLKT